jgi:copper chaperone CopZ
MVMPSHAHEHTAWWQIAPTMILIFMFAKFAVEDLQMMFGRMKTQAFDVTIEVSGMTCNGCVGRLQKTLLAHKEIDSAQVQLEPGQAKISGTISQQDLLELIDATGFKPGERI